MAKRRRKNPPENPEYEPAPFEIVDIALDKLEEGDMPGCLEILRQDPDIYRVSLAVIRTTIGNALWTTLLAEYWNNVDQDDYPVQGVIDSATRSTPEVAFIEADWIIQRWQDANDGDPIAELFVEDSLTRKIDQGGWAHFPRIVLEHDLETMTQDPRDADAFAHDLIDRMGTGALRNLITPGDWYTYFDGEVIAYGNDDKSLSFVNVDSAHQLPKVEITPPAPRITISYETLTPGPENSDEFVDYAEERGWENENGVVIDVDDFDEEDAQRKYRLRDNNLINDDASDDDLRIAVVATNILTTEGGLGMEPSSSIGGPGTWYTNYVEADYRTGAQTSYSYHLEGFTPEQERLVFILYRTAGRLVRLGGVQ